MIGVVYKQVSIDKLMLTLKVVVTMIYDSCKNNVSSKSVVVYIFYFWHCLQKCYRTSSPIKTLLFTQFYSPSMLSIQL